jgi:hypothetical protein
VTCPGTSDPAIAANWTRHPGNPIYGNGVIESSPIICPNVTKVDGTYILYYVRLSDMTLRGATSLNGVTFAYWGNMGLSLPPGAIYFGNTHVWREAPATWFMIVDAYLQAADRWASFLATSPNGGDWTWANGGAELSTLAIHPGGTYGSVHLVDGMPKINGLYQGWGHASNVAGNVIGDIYRWHSPDRITWTAVEPKPILTHLGSEFEIDQAADPHVIEVGGKSFMAYDATDNTTAPGTTNAVIKLATFDGTIADLIEGT